MTDDATRPDRTGLRIGVDVGGTFTDLVGFDPAGGTYHSVKVASTPSDPARGVVDGLRQLFEETGFDPSEVTVLSHGSTVSVNALLERAGAATGLLITEGFDAVPVAGLGSRPAAAVKDPRYEPPEPLVPPRLTRGVPERVDSDGTIRRPLDEGATREAIRDLRERGVEAIAVCLLFAFLEPAHERRVAELVNEEHPDCAVSRSSSVSPRIREYPRLSTTVVNAYVDRRLGDYLGRLEASLADVGVDPDELTMMLSHGGLSSFEEAASTPVNTLLSGPAAGVRGALFAAGLAGVEDLVTMDMGGTSCDVSVAPGGEPVETTRAEFSGQPVSVPMIDVRAIGAGGGTLVHVEEGRLAVGPASAGADPGPVCYGRGGETPTVTDADAVLGRFDPGAVLGGDRGDALERAERAIERRVAEPLSLSVEAAAAGVRRVVDDVMKKELSLALIREGYDPRTFSLVAYGGAGPMHAVAIAAELNVGRVLVPPVAGVNSAVGLLATDRERLFERSAIERLAAADLEAHFHALEGEAHVAAEAAGIPLDACRLERALELRYAGQSYELAVDVAAGDDASALRERFTAAHESAFGHTSDEPVETTTYRVRLVADTPHLEGSHLRAAAAETGPGRGATAVDARDGRPVDPEPASERPVYVDGGFKPVPVYRRSDLPVGASFEGPAIVEQPDATTVVESDATARVDVYGNLVLEVGR